MTVSDLKDKYLAFVLTPASRAKLLERCPPKYANIIAHHVTIEFNPTAVGLDMLEKNPKPRVRVMAYGGDEKIDCVLVNVVDTCRRSDGSWYHITLSCSQTGKPVDSNAFLKLSQNRDILDWSPSNDPLVLEGELKLLKK